MISFGGLRGLWASQCAEPGTFGNNRGPPVARARGGGGATRILKPAQAPPLPIALGWRPLFPHPHHLRDPSGSSWRFPHRSARATPARPPLSACARGGGGATAEDRTRRPERHRSGSGVGLREGYVQVSRHRGEQVPCRWRLFDTAALGWCVGAQWPPPSSLRQVQESQRIPGVCTGMVYGGEGGVDSLAKMWADDPL